MSYDDFRNHLKQALDEGVTVDKGRVSEILTDSDIRVAEGIKKMKPLIQLLDALKNQVTEIEGLKISPIKIGYIAILETRTPLISHSYSISTSFDNSKYTIEEFSSYSGDGAFLQVNYEYDTVSDVMAKVMEIVGEHIGAKEIQSESQSEKTNA